MTMKSLFHVGTSVVMFFLMFCSTIIQRHTCLLNFKHPLRVPVRSNAMAVSFFPNKVVSTDMLPHAGDSIQNIGVDFAKLVVTAMQKSHNPTIMMLLGLWSKMVPPMLRSLFSSMYLGDLLMFALFQLSYKRSLRWAHKLQIIAWRLLSMGTVQVFNKSILGFLEERAGLLSKLMGANYAIKLICLVLTKLGFHIRADLPILISKVLYAMYITHWIDLFKTRFMPVFLPALAENRRSSYVFTRSSSVVVWSVGVLVACEMVSTYMRVPLTSTLAFGGVGGLVLGFSARDVAANFLGGMLLLFNEPFTPGDMVTFNTGKTELVGRVERVGWGQTRIRGRDTRPTYIPNSHFVQTAVTNMERITHRKMETNFHIRHHDAEMVQVVVQNIKDGIRPLPKLDVLSMPFRVSFVRVGSYGLEIEVVCYFATKSIDEFLMLQQMANLEILKAISIAGAQLALPTSQIYHNALGPSGVIPSRMAPTAVQQPVAAAATANMDNGKTDHLKTALPPPVAATVTTPQHQHQQQQQKSQRVIADPPKPAVSPLLVSISSSNSGSYAKPMRVVSLDGHDAGDLYSDMQQQGPPLVKQRVGVSPGHATIRGGSVVAAASSSSLSLSSSQESAVPTMSKMQPSRTTASTLAAASTIQLTQAPSVTSSSSSPSSLSAELRNSSSSSISTSNARTTASAASSKAANVMSQPITMPNMDMWNYDQALGGTAVLGRASVAVAAAILSNEIVVAMRGRESDDVKAKAASSASAVSSTGSSISMASSNSMSSSINPNNSSSSSNSASPQAKPGQSLSSATLYAAMIASYEVTSASPMYSIDDVIDADSNYPWHATETDGSWDDTAGKGHSIDDNDDTDDDKWIEVDTTFGEW